MGGKQVEKPLGRKAIDEATRKRCGERMRRARMEAGYKTISDASEATGLSYQQLYDWEAGIRIPCMDTLTKLIDLGYPAETLFPEGKGKSKDKPKSRPKPHPTD